MGLLVDGKWQDDWYDTEKTGGRFKREEAVFRNWITADGSSGFKAEPGRYHLYVSMVCPWAHRTLLFRKLKGLEDAISLDLTSWAMDREGWSFRPDKGSDGDSIHGAGYLHEVYTAAKSDYTGRVTVPTLWDRERETVVSNESSEIIRMFNTAFDAWGRAEVDFYPESLRDEIDTINDRVYSTVNNGVYKAGFATSQDAYDGAVTALFESLDWLETILDDKRYLTGGRLTEADLRLLPTLVRFDIAYHGAFKCNLRRIADYPNLSNYLRELYQMPGVADTIDLEAIKRGYYALNNINPNRIVPRGPVLEGNLDLTAPHNRDRLAAA